MTYLLTERMLELLRDVSTAGGRLLIEAKRVNSLILLEKRGLAVGYPAECPSSSGTYEVTLTEEGWRVVKTHHFPGERNCLCVRCRIDREEDRKVLAFLNACRWSSWDGTLDLLTPEERKELGEAICPSSTQNVRDALIGAELLAERYELEAGKFPTPPISPGNTVNESVLKKLEDERVECLRCGKKWGYFQTCPECEDRDIGNALREGEE